MLRIIDMKHLGDILSQNGINCNWNMNILNESDFTLHKQAVKKIKLILLGWDFKISTDDDSWDM